jgi:hypothetical protein
MQMHFAFSIQQLLCRMSEAGQSTGFCIVSLPDVYRAETSGMHLNRLMKWLLPMISYLYENSHRCATRCCGNCCTTNVYVTVPTELILQWIYTNLIHLPWFVLLRVNASTCFGRYSPIFRRVCTSAIWCNCVCRRCVECTQHKAYARNYTK